jgi:flagellar assembly factor FliW
MKKFHSLRFGDLAYDPQDTICMPEGLVGLPDLQNWLLLEMDDDIPLKWLLSLDREDFCLPVADPAYFSSQYEVKVPARVKQVLGADSEASLAVMIITTIHPGGSSITGNLLAPLVIDIETRRGIQVPQEDENLSMRQEIDYFKFGLAVKGFAAENEDSSAGGQDSDHPEAAQEQREKVST